jgi:hypothetical protein
MIRAGFSKGITMRISPVFYGTNKEFDKFVVPTRASLRGKGILFYDSLEYAKEFGKIIYVCEVELKKAKEYDQSLNFTLDEIKNGNLEKMYAKLKNEGYDGIVIFNSKVSVGWVKEVIKFDGANIKIIEKIK